MQFYDPRKNKSREVVHSLQPCKLKPLPSLKSNASLTNLSTNHTQCNESALPVTKHRRNLSQIDILSQSKDLRSSSLSPNDSIHRNSLPHSQSKFFDMNRSPSSIANIYTKKLKPILFHVENPYLALKKYQPEEDINKTKKRRNLSMNYMVYDPKSKVFGPRSNVHHITFQQKLLNPVQISSKLFKTPKANQNIKKLNSFSETEISPIKKKSVLKSLEDMYFQDLRPVKEDISKAYLSQSSPYESPAKKKNKLSQSYLKINKIAAAVVKTDKDIMMEALASPYEKRYFPEIKSPNKNIQNYTLKELEFKAHILKSMKELEEGLHKLRKNTELPLVKSSLSKKPEEAVTPSKSENLLRSNYSQGFSTKKTKLEEVQNDLPEQIEI